MTDSIDIENLINDDNDNIKINLKTTNDKIINNKDNNIENYIKIKKNLITEKNYNDDNKIHQHINTNLLICNKMQMINNDENFESIIEMKKCNNQNKNNKIDNDIKKDIKTNELLQNDEISFKKIKNDNDFDYDDSDLLIKNLIINDNNIDDTEEMTKDININDDNDNDDDDDDDHEIIGNDINVDGNNYGELKDDDNSISIGPTSERWAPLGADNEDITNTIDNNVFLQSSASLSSILNNSVTLNNSIIPSSSLSYYNHHNDPLSTNRIKSLEEEQEILTTSLMALTSHFAQVQFRLRQIVEAPATERDQLLKNLEEFAFRGIPEITGNLNPIESEEVISNLERARQRQFELIDRLKRQLTELEKFAYESGAPVLPQSILIEKQKIIIDELKNKLNLNVNDTDLPQLTTEDLRNHVDTAIGEFVGPLKMKEQLVAQLKTQITDLERFIAFLQGETTILNKTSNNDDQQNDAIDAYNSYAAKKKHISNNKTAVAAMTVNNHSRISLPMKSSENIFTRFDSNTKKSDGGKASVVAEAVTTTSTNSNGITNGGTTSMDHIINSKKFERRKNRPIANHYQKDNNDHNNSSSTLPSETAANNDTAYSIGSFTKAHNLLDKAATLLQMFAVAQFGCGSNRFQKNTLKKTAKYNHWGDLRAQLEVDIQEIISLLMARDQRSSAKSLVNNKNKTNKNSSNDNIKKHNEVFREFAVDDDTDEEDISGGSSSSSSCLSDKIKNSHNHYNNKHNSSLSQQPHNQNQNQNHQNHHIHHNRFNYKHNQLLSVGSKVDPLSLSSNKNLTSNNNIADDVINAEITALIRKRFAVTLQKLIQHGLRIENDTTTNLVPFMGCLNPTTLRETSSSSSSYRNNGFYNNNGYCDNNYYDDNDYNNYDVTNAGYRQLHAWELILEYYNIKNGEQYNETPARKLSQSFNLDIAGGTATSNKQSLLSAIGTIIAMHSPYKRSYNSHFKAFICAGLNSHKIVQWLNLIFQCSELIETYYTSWSYVAKTGFRDSLKSIDRLNKYDFNLPVDLAIRQFQNIKDVFM